jgi:GDPmannose 4,6-dehydratase
VARTLLGLDRRIYLGNLEAARDWGHARDYVEAQWLILQQTEPEDFVIATGEQHTVREFCEAACEELGVFVEWKGRDEEEHGVIARLDRALVRERLGVDSAVDEGYVLFRVDPRYFRPSEVEFLVGDYTKARTKLGWRPETSWRELVSEMVTRDVELASMDILCRSGAMHPSQSLD